MDWLAKVFEGYVAESTEHEHVPDQRLIAQVNVRSAESEQRACRTCRFWKSGHCHPLGVSVAAESMCDLWSGDFDETYDLEERDLAKFARGLVQTGALNMRAINVVESEVGAHLVMEVKLVGRVYRFALLADDVLGLVQDEIGFGEAEILEVLDEGAE